MGVPKEDANPFAAAAAAGAGAGARGPLVARCPVESAQKPSVEALLKDPRLVRSPSREKTMNHKLVLHL